MLPYIAGRAYFPKGSYGTFLAAADTAYATPFIPSAPGLVFDRIGVNVTTIGAGADCDVRFGIYEDDGKGRPGKLLGDFGVKAALTSTGEHKVDVTTDLRPLLWPNRVYWLVAAFDGAATTQPTVAALATAVVPQEIAGGLGVANLGALPSSAATAGVGLSAAHTFGALPVLGSSLTWAVVLNAAVPMVGLRAA